MFLLDVFGMSNPKIAILEAEIEQKWLDRNLVELKELISKYHRKYYPQGTCWSNLLLVQAEFDDSAVSYDLYQFIPDQPCDYPGMSKLLSDALALPAAANHATATQETYIWLAYLNLYKRDFQNADVCINKVVDLNVMAEIPKLMYYTVNGIIF